MGQSFSGFDCCAKRQKSQEEITTNYPADSQKAKNLALLQNLGKDVQEKKDKPLCQTSIHPIQNDSMGTNPDVRSTENHQDTISKEPKVDQTLIVQEEKNETITEVQEIIINLEPEKNERHKENEKKSVINEDYKDKLSKRKAELEKKTKIEGTSKDAAVKLAQLKQSMLQRNTQNPNCDENKKKDIEKNHENKPNITEINSNEDKNNDKNQKKLKYREAKSLNPKKPLESINEDELDKIPHITPANRYIVTSSGKKIKESLGERIALLEKELGGKQTQENNVEIKKEEPSPEKSLVSSNDQNVKESQNNNHFKKDPQMEMETKPEKKFIHSITGMKINKNLAERVKMLETLFGCQNSSTNGDPEETIIDRTQSDNTADFRMFRSHDQSIFLKRQQTEGAKIALEHLTLERSPMKHGKNKSSLLYKSLDLD